MSTYIPDSEISLFNNSIDTKLHNVSPELFKVIKEAIHIYKISNGAFDITVNPLVTLWGFGNKPSRLKPPMDSEIESVLKQIGTNHLELVDTTHIKKQVPHLEIDLSALAKGYGVDVVARQLEKDHIENFLVEIGGEIVVSGKNISGEKWSIGIDRPKYLIMDERELQDTIYISDAAMATSGDYRNFFEYDGKIYSHTMNPKTGRPITHNLASATIIAQTCMRADALATAVMVMGPEDGLNFLESLKDIEGLLLVRNKNGSFQELATSGFRKYEQVQHESNN